MVNYNLVKAQEQVGGPYNFVLIAAQRAREISKGSDSLIEAKDGALVTAIKEIEGGLVGKNYLEKFRRR